MRPFIYHGPQLTFTDWLWYFRTRRMLWGMWWARHFPKRKRKAREKRYHSPVSAIWGSAARAQRAQEEMARQAHEPLLRQYQHASGEYLRVDPNQRRLYTQNHHGSGDNKMEF